MKYTVDVDIQHSTSFTSFFVFLVPETKNILPPYNQLGVRRIDNKHSSDMFRHISHCHGGILSWLDLSILLRVNPTGPIPRIPHSATGGFWMVNFFKIAHMHLSTSWVTVVPYVKKPCLTLKKKKCKKKISE